MNSFQKLTAYFLILAALLPMSVWAVGSDNKEETFSRDFILNAGGEAGDVALSFGDGIGKYLQWSDASARFEINDDFRIEGNNAVVGQIYVAEDHDATDSDGFLNIGRDSGGWKGISYDATTNDRFEFNDDILVDGNMAQNGTTLILDADNTGPAADVSIVANQGGGNPAVLRFNSTESKWEFSDDGTSYNDLGGVADVTSQTQTLANDSTFVMTHDADADNKRIVQIKQFVNTSGGTDSSLDFESADEGNYTQEDATNGTDLLGGAVILAANFLGGSGTTNLAQGQPASASSSSQPASNGVDANDGTFWYTTAGGADGGWIEVDLGAGAPAINEAQIRWYNTTGTYNCTTFEIQGTNTSGSGYTTVFTADTSGDPQESTYNFSPSYYQYWRFLCTVANNGSYYVLREARLFEALVTYPTTPYYVTTNTNSVSTSSWTGVTSFNITQNTPTNTSLRYLVSFDGGTTWKYWNGSAWTNSSLANLQTEGMTEATLEALTTGQWFAAGGVNSDAAETLDIAIDLATTDVNETPSVSQIDITYTTPSYWTKNTDGYEIREYNSTQTSITNRTGSTQDIRVNIILPSE